MKGTGRGIQRLQHNIVDLFPGSPSCSRQMKPSRWMDVNTNTHTHRVADAFSALNNRQKFLQCKEKLIISTLFSDFGLSDDTKFFTGDIVNDSEFLKASKGIALNYENFRTVYNEYLRQKQKERTSIIT